MTFWMWIGVGALALAFLGWVVLWRKRRVARRKARAERKQREDSMASELSGEALGTAIDLHTVSRSWRGGKPHSAADDVAPSPSGFRTEGGFGGRAMDAKAAATAEASVIPVAVPMPMNASATSGTEGFTTGGGFGGAEDAADVDSWGEVLADAADSLGELASGAVEVAGAVAEGAVTVVTEVVTNV